MIVVSALLALGAAGQGPAPAAPPTPVVSADAAAQRGVIAYPPEFFAAAQPSTALDMITRLPGFSLEQGDSVRGFAGDRRQRADQWRAPDQQERVAGGHAAADLGVRASSAST
jgi:hypothetical protein